MKNCLILLFILAIIAISSCSKDNPTNTNNTSPFGKFTAKIDGIQWQPVIINNFFPRAFYQESPKRILIYGKLSNNNEIDSVTITFSLPNIVTGEYILYNSNTTNCQALFYHNNNPSIYTVLDDSGLNGSITLTKIDLTNKIIQGTFNCTLKNTAGTGEQKTITEGSFDVKITNDI